MRITLKKFTSILLAAVLMVSTVIAVTATAFAATTFTSVGLIGQIDGGETNWASDDAYEMTYADGVWSITLEFTGGANNFKARANDAWDVAFGRGGDGENTNYVETLTGKYTISIADGAANGDALTVEPYSEPAQPDVPDEPVTGESNTIYFDASAVDSDGNRFAVYMYVDAEATGKEFAEAWVDAATVSEGVYSADIPDTYTNFIFVRMDGATTENTFETGVWGQSENLAYDGTNNLYTIEGYVPNTQNLTGAWSVYSENPENPDVPDVPDEPAQGFTSVGLIGVINGGEENWASDDAYEMTLADGVWSITLDFTGGTNNFKARANDAWDVAFGIEGTGENTNYTETLTGKYTISIADGAADGTALTVTSVVEPDVPDVPDEPITGESNTIYFDASAIDSDGNRFAVYMYVDAEATGKEFAEAWVDAAATGNGLYSAEIPDTYTNFIFVRMDGATTENTFETGVWGQSENLAYDGTNNLYTIEGYVPDTQNLTGAWSVYSDAPIVPDEPDEPVTPVPENAVCVVAGTENLCGDGIKWVGTPDSGNVMTLADGVYTLTFENVQPAEGVQLKVVINAEDGTQEWVGDATGNNVTFNVTEACDVTVAFDAATREITVTGAGVQFVTELEINSVYVAGNGDEAWLNGIAWDPTAEANKMTEVSDGVYEISYKGVYADNNLQVKFVANCDAAWKDSWGGVCTESGAPFEAVYNGSNIIVNTSAYESSDVTLTIDLSAFDYATKSGAVATITVTESSSDTPDQPDVPDEPITGESNTIYFDASAVDSDGNRFAVYMYVDSEATGKEFAEAWVDAAATSNGLYSAEIPDTYTNFIFVRMDGAATENTFDTGVWGQTENLAYDGTNNLYTIEGYVPDTQNLTGAWSVYSDAPIVPDEPDEPVTPVPENAVCVVAGSEALCGVNWVGTPDSGNVMTLADGSYTLTFENVQPAEGLQLKVVINAEDGTQEWVGDATGNNVTFNVTEACDVTVAFDAATREITVTGAGVQFVTELEINSVYVAGNGDEAWLNGIAWDPTAESNKMTEVSDGVYEISYKGVYADNNLQVKFVANCDAAWKDSWGGDGSKIESGVPFEAVYNGSNIVVDTSAYENSDVTLTIDLSAFDYATKSGAVATITVTESSSDTPDEPITGESNTIYFDASAVDSDGNRFAVYMYVDSEATGKEFAEAWVDAAATGNGLYSAEIPDTYTNFIFVRMDGATTENTWETGVWGQTENLAYDGTNNLYTIEGYVPDTQNLTGAWSVYSDAPDVPDVPDEPGTSVPESSVPESSVPESSVPESSVPESSVPESSVPESSVPVVADKLTVKATSNFFPESTYEFTEDGKLVTVTYYLTSEKDILNTQWYLYYDSSKLKIADANAAFMPIVSGGVVYNTDTDGIIAGNASSLSLYALEGKTPFVQVTFEKASDDAVGEAVVDLQVQVLTVSKIDPDTFSSDTNEEEKLVQNYVINEEATGYSTETEVKAGEDVPESSVPESSVPESSVPESSVPESSVPESSVPESSVPESSVPESSVPEESTPATDATDATSGTGTTVAPGSTNTNTNNNNSGAVQTGNSPMALVILLVLASATAAVYFARKRVR